MLSYCLFRWLTYEAAVGRIVEQHEGLKLYFTTMCLEDPTATNDLILLTVKDPLFKPFMHFVLYVLGRFNELNTAFQAEVPALYELKPSIHQFVVELGHNFLTSEYLEGLEDASHLNAHHSSAYVPLQDIYVGK